jgi:NADH-quinone oxidoreductase subunit N
VQVQWADALAALAYATIIIGNVGAIPQRSLKRMLAWSGVAQAGYILAGIVVGTQLGVQALFFYLAVYLFMNIAAFAVIVARERVSTAGDDISSLDGLGRADPWLAWPMTIAMLALAGFPATAGFMGKFYLLRAAVEGGYAWLAVFIVIGSVISLGYYLRVVAAMWMAPVHVEVPAGTGPPRRVASVSGWSPDARAVAQPEVLLVAVVAAAAVVFFGIIPGPLFDLAKDVGTALQNVFA